MEHNDKKLKLDLDFLGEGVPAKSEKKHVPKEHKPEHTKPEQAADADAPMSDSAKWILGAIGVAVLIIIIAAASSGGSSSTTTTDTSTVGTTNTLPPPNPSLDTSDTNTIDAPVAKPKKAAPIYTPPATTADDCTYGETYDSTAGECVTPLQYCQNRNGSNATYNSSDNSCGCAAGYTFDGSRCSLPRTGYQVCADMNATWDGYSMTDSGGYNCTCGSGYTPNAAGTMCVAQPVKSGYQVCSEAYPNETWDGTYSSDGKYNCVCKAGYTWSSYTNSCY
jgi:hypothetical protein